MPEDRKPCRCLLKDSDASMAESVQAYIDSLPEEIRTDDAERRTRLDLCMQCPQLIDGTCRLCGCYVEARSAKRTVHCPSVPPKW